MTDDIVKKREQELRKLLEKDNKLRIKEYAQVEVSQVCGKTFMLFSMCVHA